MHLLVVGKNDLLNLRSYVDFHASDTYFVECLVLCRVKRTKQMQ